MRVPLLLALLTGCTEYDFSAYEAVDVFFQNPAAEVDVLLVIDNSGSMAGWQILLGARFDEFLTYFDQAGVDYRIGVINTTVERPSWPGDGCTHDDLDAMPVGGELAGGTFITRDTPDAEELFDDLVRVGTCGSGDERGLETARLALSPELLEGGNAGFLRPEASLSLVFVSDEQDGSAEPVHHYINDFYEVKGQRVRDVLDASALVITDAEACPVTVAESAEGSRYVAVAEETGGVTGNLCNTNFEDIVTEIGLSASRLRDTYFLSDWPAVDSLEVTVEEGVLPCDSGAWRYDVVLDHDVEKPAIVFDRDHMPQPSDQIAVRYNLGAGEPLEGCPTPEAE